MDELFSGSMLPITETIGFLEYPCHEVVAAFINWMAPIQKKRSVQLLQREVSGNLQDVLATLLPLTNVERRRYLFIPTTNDWTAYFDNGHQGTDAYAPISYLAKILKCRGVRTTLSNKKNMASRILEIYGAEQTAWLNTIRSITVAQNDGKWEFHLGGDVQPFEQIERYQALKINDRFTADMLNDYLRALNIFAFEENFYLPENYKFATLIEKDGPSAPNVKEFTL